MLIGTTEAEKARLGSKSRIQQKFQVDFGKFKRTTSQLKEK